MRQFLKSCLFWPLRFKPVRRRVLFWASQEQYPELGLRVPLSHALACPILSPEYWCSFSEMFVQGEYRPLLEKIPPPDRWIDLGCHAGFFSLYLAWQRAARGIHTAPECLLVDADLRVGASIDRIRTINELPGFRFVHGAVGSGAEVDFTERGFMASAVAGLDSSSGITRRIPVASEARLQELLPPPYDLLKVDIEGSEFDLLQNYSGLLRSARHLLLEWHSWQAGGGGREQLVQLAAELGFEQGAEIQPPREVAPGRTCGVLLFANSRFAPAPPPAALATA